MDDHDSLVCMQFMRSYVMHIWSNKSLLLQVDKSMELLLNLVLVTCQQQSMQRRQYWYKIYLFLTFLNMH